MTVDLSTAALERLLALDGQRTPGECRAQWGSGGGFIHRVLAEQCIGRFARIQDAEAIAAAVNALSPLVRELLLTRKQLRYYMELADEQDHEEAP